MNILSFGKYVKEFCFSNGMTYLTSISYRINNLLKENNISAYKLCRSCNIPQSSFSRMVRNQWEWKLDYLVRIADYFKTSLEYLVFGELQRAYKKLLEDYNTLYKENLTMKHGIGKLESIENILLEWKEFKSKQKMQA